MTSFASLFRDGRLIIDKTKTYAANPFPSWMDIITFQKQTLK
jgi:hypothetical protein